MGFLDRAKQLAEQAQDKIDDVQKQFNDSQSAKSGSAGSEPAVEYDKHGRPTGQTQPEATTQAAVAPDAAPDAGPASPGGPEASPPPPPAADTPREGPVTPPSAPPAPSEGDDEPPQVTHGDPLAG
jgi:hypothetical protein